MSNPRTIAAICLFILTALSLRAEAAEPLVVATIRPIHSLVSALLVRDKPILLYSGAESPHEAALRPSQVRALEKANLILRIDAGFETALKKPLRSIAIRSKVMTLSKVEGITRLPRRGGKTGRKAGKKNTDPHIWLDPRNAATLVLAIAEALATRDPLNALAYLTRAERTATKLKQLERKIAARLRGRPTAFVAGHDAFQYFETRYGLKAVGALVGPDGSRIGARGARRLRYQAKTAKVGCVLDDSSKPSRLARSLATDLGARVAGFDVLGSSLKPGVRLYPAMLQQGAKALATCLGKK